jgi:hypothetical protein
LWVLWNRKMREQRFSADEFVELSNNLIVLGCCSLLLGCRFPLPGKNEGDSLIGLTMERQCGWLE